MNDMEVCSSCGTPLLKGKDCIFCYFKDLMEQIKIEEKEILRDKLKLKELEKNDLSKM